MLFYGEIFVLASGVAPEALLWGILSSSRSYWLGEESCRMNTVFVVTGNVLNRGNSNLERAFSFSSLGGLGILLDSV